ncbi:MAG: potassium-transporting ATPase [Mycobacterium sp.]|nr:potassium-transporting ATPase [Mycobacterium sp.]
MTTALSTVIYVALTVAIFAVLGLVQRLVERL